MKSVFKTTQSVLFTAVPVVAASTIAALPGQAATFSLSAAETTLSNFSVVPSNIGTSTETDTLTVSVGSGTAIAKALAGANFNPEVGENFSRSIATGSGNRYFGVAESQASLVGQFLLRPQETFSFDFASRLVLKTAISNSKTETAIASGTVLFQLIDNQTETLIDTFGLFAESSVPGTSGFPRFQPFTTGSTSTTLSTTSESKENSQFFSALFSGSYFRTFESETNLSLVEVKANRAAVEQVPTPSAVVGIFVFLFQDLRRSWAKKKAKMKASANS